MVADLNSASLYTPCAALTKHRLYGKITPLFWQE